MTPMEFRMAALMTNTPAKLEAAIDEDDWATQPSDTSQSFDKPESGRIVVKVINHLGDEVMNVFRVA